MKRWIIVLIFLLFEVLALFTAYLYSLRSDVFGGDSGRDGLYFLLYLYFILPFLLVIAIVKIVLVKNGILRYSYILYALLMTIPLMVDIIPRRNEDIGVVVCLTVALFNVLELLSKSVRAGAGRGKETGGQ